MRGTEEEGEEEERRELQEQHLIFCFLLGIVDFCLPRILSMCIYIKREREGGRKRYFLMLRKKDYAILLFLMDLKMKK